MRLFLTRQEPPTQRFVLFVLFVQRDGCQGFGHFIAQVKSVARVDIGSQRTGQDLV